MKKRFLPWLLLLAAVCRPAMAADPVPIVVTCTGDHHVEYDEVYYDCVLSRAPGCKVAYYVNYVSSAPDYTIQTRTSPDAPWRDDNPRFGCGNAIGISELADVPGPPPSVLSDNHHSSLGPIRFMAHPFSSRLQEFRVGVQYFTTLPDFEHGSNDPPHIAWSEAIKPWSRPGPVALRRWPDGISRLLTVRSAKPGTGWLCFCL